MSDVAQAGARAGGVLAATCISTLVVNANTSAVSILLPGDLRGHRDLGRDAAVGGDRLLAGRRRGDRHVRFAG